MSKTKVINAQKTRTKTCVFCGNTKLSEVIDFGDMALAGAFLTKEQIPNEKKYPLVIVFCEVCYVVQVRDHIDPKVLFANDFYFSSAIKTLRDHFVEYAAEVTDRFLKDPHRAVAVEFGSNDGVLLRPLAKEGIGTVIGVDPATNITKSVNSDEFIVINDFFNVATSKSIKKKYGKANLIMANNVFAHISDINGATDGVYNLLADDGVFVFEVHYLGKIIEEMQYDFIYHEHIYYYSLIALQNHLNRHGMVIFDIKPISIHGGSIRYYAAKKSSKHTKNISSSVTKLRDQELELGYDKASTYIRYGKSVAIKKHQLMSLLEKLKAEGKSIVGYGASGRANTIIQYCGITGDHIDYIIDDAPAKQGLYTPGSHIEIKANKVLTADHPNYILIFAWAFYKEIIAKLDNYIGRGGRVIVPLPEVKIYPTEEQP
ncbi:MAG TPA: class I SAM-dependent methyltransferase [Candidatus Saccharimonadales bacterium]|nr:class I SAM-dependent methyltransferase [Candidatus Saccharimonadales bacterium]